VPAAWCDGHHLRHWTDGGATDLANGALLCGRHHDLVHAKGFHGQVVDGVVQWDLTPGAYDHWLRHRQGVAGDAKAAVRAYDGWGELQTQAADALPPPWRP
jgi:hypothetical protein